MFSLTVAAPPPAQKDSFGDLLGSMGMPPPMPVQPANGEAQPEPEISPGVFISRVIWELVSPQFMPLCEMHVHLP